MFDIIEIDCYDAPTTRSYNGAPWKDDGMRCIPVAWRADAANGSLGFGRLSTAAGPTTNEVISCVTMYQN